MASLLAGLAGGGLSTSSSSAAGGGEAGSGRNVISVGGFPPNLESIVNAVQGGGSSRVGGNNVQQPTYLGPVKSSGFDVSLPGVDAGINLSPLLIFAAAGAFLILPRLMKK